MTLAAAPLSSGAEFVIEDLTTGLFAADSAGSATAGVFPSTSTAAN